MEKEIKRKERKKTMLEEPVHLNWNPHADCSCLESIQGSYEKLNERREGWKDI